MDNEISLHKKLDAIKNAELTITEQKILIDELTNNGKPDRLISLIKDVEEYLNIKSKQRNRIDLSTVLTETSKNNRVVSEFIPTNFQFDFDKAKLKKWEIKKTLEEQSSIEFYSPPKKLSKEIKLTLNKLRSRIISTNEIHQEHQLYPIDLSLVLNFLLLIIKKFHGDETTNPSLTMLAAISNALPNTHIKPFSYYKFNTNKDFEYPDPKVVAEQYHKEKGSKHREYSANDIAPVMEVTKTYIKKKPKLTTIHGHIKTIIDKCNGLTGGRDAKSNWIKFYAEKAGLENK